MTNNKRIPKRRAAPAASEKKEDTRAIPLGMLFNFAMGMIKDAEIKDAINRVADSMMAYINGVLLRVDQLEKDVKTLQHSIELMVKARQRLGLMDDLKDIKFGTQPSPNRQRHRKKIEALCSATGHPTECPCVENKLV